MRIIIAGGSGLIGSYLKNKFEEAGNTIEIISRQSGFIAWEHDQLVAHLENSDVLINLSGRSINCRHNAVNQAQILNSRVESTRMLGTALKDCSKPPTLWINASASAIYSHSDKTQHSENSNDFANDFLSKVVETWEKTFFGFQIEGVRQVALRTSVVLDTQDGAFKPLLLLSRFGLGGKVGNGKQVFSWIHIEDYYRIVKFIINNHEIDGVVNCNSPFPVSNALLMSAFRKSVNVKIGIPAPKFLVKIAAFFIGTEPSLILDSTNIYPEKLIKAGFEFKFDCIDQAISNLVNAN